MNFKKITYYISKITLLDEILSILYWAVGIYGIFYLSKTVNGTISLSIILGVYIITIAIFYIIVLKKIKSYFKDKQ